ncbi:bacteriocin-like protein [Chryseobacterium arthrosphaerae]|uniref:bacteriocin-like protein n=1 Tax=Chryseobacterium arthrosphaerae TaxID=651561 RepID=UPI003D3573B0
MKNLKRISREDLKSLKGGKPGGSYGDMCSLGGNDICVQYGLECGLYFGHDNAIGTWYALRCI